LRVRSAYEAVKLLRDDLQATVSVLTRAVLRAEVVKEPTYVAAITFGRTPRVKVGPHRWIEVHMAVEAREDDAETGTWRTHTLRYYFSLFDVPAEGDFVLSYHLHPDPGGFARSHVHVRAQPSWAGKSLHKVHLPTGRVALEAFVRLIVEELDGQPIRKDWDDRLRRFEERFDQRKTW
jgi:hypothetical protein